MARALVESTGLLYVRERPFAGIWHRVYGDLGDVFGLSPARCGAVAPIELSSGRRMWGQISVDAEPVAEYEVAIYCAACARAHLGGRLAC